MNLKAGNLFLFLVVVTDFAQTVSSLDSKCPLLRLVNGRSRYRGRGRSVRFNCMKGYQLVGVKYATCMNGKWDTEVPICVKYGCHAPSTHHVNGQFIESYRGAVVKIVCNPGYTLVGSPSVYCNGVKWNETFPVCRVKNSNPALSCDFETPDLCGWSQDPMHDVDWRRRNGSSSDAGTGSPAAGGNNSTGHFMYMESSSSRTENDSARLYSPVYPSELSNGTCFKFWYHMEGTATAFLKVYVKPEDVELFSLIPSFWINGQQGKPWMQGFFLIEPMETPFQIVMEGVRGSGAVGDTAFDDVKLTTAEECKILQEMTSSTESSSSVNPDDDAVDSFSCKNRCSQEKTHETTAAATPENDRCNCYETCDRDGTCCSDYFDFCSPFQSTPSSSPETDVMSSSSSVSSSPPTGVPIPESKPELPPHHFNNESNEIFPGKSVEQIPPDNFPNEIPRVELPTTRRTTLKMTKTTKTLRKTTEPQNRPEIPREKVETGGTTRKPEQRKVAKVVGNKPAKPATNKAKANGTTKDFRPRVEWKPETRKSASVTSSVSTTTARVWKNPRPNDVQYQKALLEKPSNTNPLNEFRYNNGKPKEVSGKEPPQAIKIDQTTDENNGGTVRGIVEVGSAAIAIFVIIILGIFWYRRREYRKAERENMVEDSDSIVCKMDSTTVGSESYSMVCIRPGGLQQTL